MPTYYDINKMQEEDRLKAEQEASEAQSPEVAGQIYEPKQNEQMYTPSKPMVEEDIAQLLDAYNISKIPMATPATGYISPNTEDQVIEALNQDDMNRQPALEDLNLSQNDNIDENQEDLGAEFNKNVNLGIPSLNFNTQPTEVNRIKGNASPRQNQDQIKQLEELLGRYKDFSSSAQERMTSAQKADQQTGILNALNMAANQANQALANRAGTTDIKTNAAKFDSQYAKDLAARLGIEENQLEKEGAIGQLINKAKSPVGEIKQLGNELYEVQPDGTIKALVAGGSGTGELSEKDKAFLELRKLDLDQKKQMFEDSEKRRVEQQDRAYGKSKLDSARALLKDDPRFKKAVEQSMEFDTVRELINEVKVGNPTSIAPLGIKLAKAMGEVGVMTDTDVVRYIQSTKWGDQLLGWWKKGAQGELPADVTKGLESNIDTISTKLNSNINKVYDTASGRLKSTYKDMSDDEIQQVLGVRPVVDVNSKKKELSTEDKAALDWANKNPKDPRADKIKQKLGM